MIHLSLDHREFNLLLNAARRSPTGGDVAALLADGNASPSLTRAQAEEAVAALDLFTAGKGAFSEPASQLRDMIAASLAGMSAAA